ncbi:hypothetical protein, variant 4 [Plasmodium yoelii 17X]|uniref:Uncharacterized protein n=2 Tax=Plasmodium yoelii TaxID=5861 RepID=A0AAE9WP76_PLAYO|nr:hypothetical protein, variant 1 [Plasmodium yoelii 17X]ETB63410.1 hypothetical protein, variant 2 [Plasmodium yoelii 17X]ETB63411.1 hypothetical protein, variant 3 [Plasmodium yoelii 17X]ETB63412.1 hypothetical protein, variant 4 [Plasmodium yoelii 17X]WBY54557.1 hypothetical protein Py17XNL_000104785 [Plasmodium yoelii yoelii]
MKYTAFKNSLRFASKFCQNNNYKLYMNSVPQFSTYAYGKYLKTNPLTNRLDDLLKKNSNLISIISLNGLDDLITQSSKIESVSIADWLLNLVEEYQSQERCVHIMSVYNIFYNYIFQKSEICLMRSYINCLYMLHIVYSIFIEFFYFLLFE